LNIQNANTISLVEGWGWVRGDQKTYGYRVRYAKEGDFIALKENTSKGSDSDATTYHTVYSASGSGIQTDLITITAPAGYAIQQLFHYVAAPATVSKPISAAGWATYCSPYALDFSSAIDNLDDAYIVTGGADGVLSKTSVKGSTVPANTGLLLKGEGACTIPVAASSSTDVSTNKLVGKTAEFALAANDGYVLMNDATNGLAFYKNTNAFTVGANTAYLPANFTGSGARGFFLLDGSDATGIGTALMNKEAMNSEVYNLQGQRVAAPTKGLYIVNGKKTIVK